MKEPPTSFKCLNLLEEHPVATTSMTSLDFVRNLIEQGQPDVLRSVLERVADEVPRRGEDVARVADEFDVHGLAAVAVAHHPGGATRAGGVAVTPLHEGEEHGLELQTDIGEPVLVARALSRLLVLDAPQHALVEQPAQAVTEDRPGEADVSLDFVEAPHSAEDLAEDEDRPLLADHLEGPADRAVLGASGLRS
jgi:hypothetical protein